MHVLYVFFTQLAEHFLPYNCIIREYTNVLLNLLKTYTHQITVIETQVKRVIKQNTLRNVYVVLIDSFFAGMSSL